MYSRNALPSSELGGTYGRAARSTGLVKKLSSLAEGTVPHMNQMVQRMAQRGRPRQQDRLEQAIQLFRLDRLALEDSGAFADARGVQALLLHLRREMLPLGTALDLLIAGAAADVQAEFDRDRRDQSQQLIRFLHGYFIEHKTVTAIAQGDLKLSRCHVSRTIAKRALSLVAQRFLALVQAENPLGDSAGVQKALEQHLQHKRASLAS